MSNPLENYIIIYEVTCLPTVLFADKVIATEPLEFNDFHIPAGLSGQPIEVRISIYDNITGDIVELNSDMVPASPGVVRHALNLSPLLMIQNLMQKLIREAQRQNALLQKARTQPPHQHSNPQDSNVGQSLKVPQLSPPLPQ